MAKPILIVGGGPAGLAAAHSLATFGQECILVDKEDRLGGAPILEGYAKLVPSGEWAKDAIGGMVERAEGHDLVNVRTSTTVKARPCSESGCTSLKPTVLRVITVM